MITVTGATGQLGGLVIAGLLDSGVPAGRIRAVVREPAKAQDLASRGVDVRRAEYGDRAALEAAFAGTDRLYLVSGTDLGQRVEQHGNVVAAAAAARVGLLIYTSGSRADRGAGILFEEHAESEAVIAESGLPAVIARHNWYLEVYDQHIGQAAATGKIIGGAGQGRSWPATRADFAAGAVALLTSDDPVPGTYELGGSEPLTLPGLAAEVGRQTGREVTYVDLTGEEHVAALVEVGLDEQTARFVAGLDDMIEAGQLDTGDQTLAEWIGRPTTPISRYVSEVLGR